MIYLTADDLSQQIKQDQLDTLTGGTAALQDRAEITAMSEMESYLRQRYDVVALWALLEDNRPGIIVTYLVDMALYHLHSRINPRKIPELRMDRYDNAIAWLKRVARGELSPNLPLLVEGADEIRWGSNQKLDHYY
jgi:phage gp36-like protein